MERVDNEHLKLKSWAEVPILLETPGFYEYCRKVYDWLEFDMPQGSELSLLSYTGIKLEWTIKIACIFIGSGYHWLEYELDQNFTKITRRKISKEELEELTRKEKVKMRTKAPDVIKQAV